MPLRIELAKPEQLRGLSFGAVPCGSCCSRTLSLVNRGRAAAFVSFEPSGEMLERLGVTMLPAGGVALAPREGADLTLLYRCARCLCMRFAVLPGGGGRSFLCSPLAISSLLAVTLSMLAAQHTAVPAGAAAVTKMRA